MTLTPAFRQGEEFTRYAGELYLSKWIRPYVDTSAWEFFDLSCVARDKSNDQVLRDAIASGKKTGAIYKEPTITPVKRACVPLACGRSHNPLGTDDGPDALHGPVKVLGLAQRRDAARLERLHHLARHDPH